MNVIKITQSLFFYIICYLSAPLIAQENLRGLLDKEEINVSEIYGNRWALVVGINEYKYFIAVINNVFYLEAGIERSFVLSIIL